jgi:hypothetical protein
MKIEFSLDAEDYLAHQLFVASASSRIRKRRNRNKILIPAMYAIFGIVQFSLGNATLSILFIGLGILWFTLYPKWETKRYLKHYSGFINENYKEMFGRNVSLEIKEDEIYITDEGGEGSILLKELASINEISRIIMLRFKGSQTIILPKNKINNLEEVKNKLKDLSIQLNIPYTTDDQWEWK